jgi:hypothetical protein
MILKQKIYSLIASAICTIALVGCGGDGDDTPKNNAPPLVVPPPAVVPPIAPPILPPPAVVPPIVPPILTPPVVVPPIVPPVVIPATQAINLSSKIVDDKGVAIQNANIYILQNNVVVTSFATLADGSINIQNINVDINKDVIAKISKDGYTDQVRNLGKFATSTKSPSASVNAALLIPTLTTNLNLAAAGTTSSTKTQGASIEYTANSFEDNSGNAPTGNVTLNMTVLDPTLYPASFPGSNIVSFGNNPTGGVLASLGMVDFTFMQNGKKFNLVAGKTAIVRLPLFSVLDNQGLVIKVGDSLPLWSMNSDTGLWKQEGTGIVEADANSPTNLVLKATVSHFSWWNCDFTQQRITKTFKIYKPDNTLYNGDVMLNVKFTQTPAATNLYTSPVVAESGIINNTNLSTNTRFPAGFNMEVLGDSSLDGVYDLQNEYFSAEAINAASEIPLHLMVGVPSIKILPNALVSVIIGKTQQFTYNSKRLGSGVKWFVDGVEGGNAASGTIDSNGKYTTTSSTTAGSHVIKVQSTDNTTVFDLKAINTAASLYFENWVADVDGKISHSKDALSVGKNALLSMIGGLPMPAGLVKYDIECHKETYYTEGVGQACDATDLAKYSFDKNDGTLTINKPDYANNARLFTEAQIAKVEEVRGPYNSYTARDLSGIALRVTISLISDPSITYTGNYMSVLNRYSLLTNSAGDGVTYKYSLFNELANADQSAKLSATGSELTFSVACSKLNGGACDSMIDRRPKIKLVDGNKKEITLEYPQNFDSICNSEQFHLVGVYKNNLLDIHSVMTNRLNGSSMSSSMSCVRSVRNDDMGVKLIAPKSILGSSTTLA